MSKYYKAESVQTLINSLKCYGIPELNLEGLPTIEVSEDNQVLYGTDHNCILTMFGECSYNETGCGSCAVAEKIRKALEDCISREQMIEAIDGVDWYHVNSVGEFLHGKLLYTTFVGKDAWDIKHNRERWAIVGEIDIKGLVREALNGVL